MKKLFSIIFIFILSGEMVFAQNKIDSLLNVLKTAKEDSNKVNALNVLTWEIINTGDYEKATQYSSEALRLAQQINFQSGEARSYSNFGGIYFNKGDYSESINFYFKSLKIKENAGDKNGMASSYNNASFG